MFYEPQSSRMFVRWTLLQRYINWKSSEAVTSFQTHSGRKLRRNKNHTQLLQTTFKHFAAAKTLNGKRLARLLYPELNISMVCSYCDMDRFRRPSVTTEKQQSN